MVLIKVKEIPIPPTKDNLRERVRKAWRINPNRLYNQDTVVAVYKGEILEVYKILSYTTVPEEDDRVAFELEEITTDLKGKKIVSRTANPCTIVEELEFK
jgi:hypothetical protein